MGSTVDADEDTVVDTDPRRILGIALRAKSVHLVLLLEHYEAVAVVFVDQVGFLLEQPGPRLGGTAQNFNFLVSQVVVRFEGRHVRIVRVLCYCQSVAGLYLDFFCYITGYLNVLHWCVPLIPLKDVLVLANF